MLSPDKLKNALKKVEEENWILRAFLKSQDPEEVDSIVHRLHKELFEDYKIQYQELWGNESVFANYGMISAAESKVNIGRNDPCSCGSGKKYKKCCGK